MFLIQKYYLEPHDFQQNIEAHNQSNFHHVFIYDTPNSNLIEEVILYCRRRVALPAVAVPCSAVTNRKRRETISLIVFGSMIHVFAVNRRTSVRV